MLEEEEKLTILGVVIGVIVFTISIQVLLLNL